MLSLWDMIPNDHLQQKKLEKCTLAKKYMKCISWTPTYCKKIGFCLYEIINGDHFKTEYDIKFLSSIQDAKEFSARLRWDIMALVISHSKQTSNFLFMPCLFRTLVITLHRFCFFIVYEMPWLFGMLVEWFPVTSPWFLNLVYSFS